MEFKTILALNLREERLKRGWSQRQLGKLAKTSGATINNIESAKNMPAVDIVLRIAIVLNTTVEQLCESVPSADSGVDEEDKKGVLPL